MSENRNIIDYVQANLMSFANTPFNPVDSLVLAQFAYIHFDQILPELLKHNKRIRIADLLKAEYFPGMLTNVRADGENRKLLFAMAASPRFRDILVANYVNKLDPQKEKQFSALTYFIDRKLAYVAFRGTDSTLVGWKEDFNMSFTMPVPSQEEAAAYLERVGHRFLGTIMVGGHSKGGNLAIYAAMYCSAAVRQRIVNVFCHDGPGFQEAVFQSPPYLAIAAQIHKTIPQSSTVGMLLEYQGDYLVVKSNEFWIMQHDPFSWQIGENDFVYEEHISNAARYTNDTISQWLNSATIEERERFIDTLYQVISETNVRTVGQLSDNIFQDGKKIVVALNNVDDKTKRFVMQTFKELVALSFKNLIPNNKNRFGLDKEH